MYYLAGRGGGEQKGASPTPQNLLSMGMATAVTYSNTNFLCVVLLSPSPHGILNSGGPVRWALAGTAQSRFLSFSLVGFGSAQSSATVV